VQALQPVRLDHGELVQIRQQSGSAQAVSF
jgi:hypothetical protein